MSQYREKEKVNANYPVPCFDLIYEMPLECARPSSLPTSDLVLFSCPFLTFSRIALLFHTHDASVSSQVAYSDQSQSAITPAPASSLSDAALAVSVSGSDPSASAFAQ